jgi:hypothetical protein
VKLKDLIRELSDIAAQYPETLESEVLSQDELGSAPVTVNSSELSNGDVYIITEALE